MKEYIIPKTKRDVENYLRLGCLFEYHRSYSNSIYEIYNNDRVKDITGKDLFNRHLKTIVNNIVNIKLTGIYYENI